MTPKTFLFSVLIGILVVLSLLKQPFDPDFPGVNAYITFIIAIPVLAVGVGLMTYFEEKK